jgi:hypothetical protein
VKQSKYFVNALIFIILACFSTSVSAQKIVDKQEKPAVNDTLKELHSPKKASKLSAILPGLGQAYNKKYWKIPFVYAGFATIGYFVSWNNKYFVQAKNAYTEIKNWKDGPYDIEKMPTVKKLEAVVHYDLNNSTSRNDFLNGLTRQQEYYRRNRDLLVISFVGFYGLNIIDASVDAHFFDFDMSDDLTLNWQPSVTKLNNQLFYGLVCSIHF